MTIPLDPGIGGKSIGSDVMQIADIIVSTTPQWKSKAIKLGTMAAVSHAALYVGGDQVVEAIGEGVVLNPIGVALSQDSLAVVYRYPSLDYYTSLQIRDFVGNQIGKPYSTAGAIASGIARFNRNATFRFGFACAKAGICVSEGSPPVTTDTFFCSQLVVAAFASADTPIINVPASECTPADIVDVAVNLLYVGHLKA